MIKTPFGDRDRDGNAGDSDGDGVCVCNGGRGSGPFVPSIFFILARRSVWFWRELNTKKQTDVEQIECGFLPR